jgi:rhodanese-related sulfurtransferase
MTVDEVAAEMAAADRRLAVFDANDRETYDERHVPGATWVDYDGVTREQLPADTSTPLVFYCYNEACSASHVAAESAVAMGFSSVSVMGAGITGWVAAGQPVEGPAAAAEGATATQ